MIVGLGTRKAISGSGMQRKAFHYLFGYLVQFSTAKGALSPPVRMPPVDPANDAFTHDDVDDVIVAE
jgi:hypothetical protein